MLFVLPLVFTLFSASRGAQVRIGATTITGKYNSLFEQEFYGGIPYASPPVGVLRFAPPVLQTTLKSTTYNATRYGKPCIQRDLKDASEDCLTINVYRPSGIPSEVKIPVMVWIYGGGFDSGSSAPFDARQIVARARLRGTPIVYVSFNYRVGPLGFPQGDEASTNGALNLGLKDQIAALKWVQANIGNFSGDKTKVTVFGQSAGSISIGYLFLNSGLENLARAAIFESGSAGSTPALSPTAKQGSWDTFVNAVPSCSSVINDTFTCLREANASEIAAGADATANLIQPWTPVLDGENGVIPDFPSRRWAQGLFAKIPFIAGTNLDEGTLFTRQEISTPDQILQALTIVYSPTLNSSVVTPVISQILAMYPDEPADGSPYGTGNNTFGLSPEYKRAASITNDVFFQAPRRAWIQAAKKAGITVYGYFFSDPRAVFPAKINPPRAPGSLGVAHASEINFVYGNPPSGPETRALSENMIDYWVSFATSLDPNDANGNKRPHWPQYDTNRQSLLELNGDSTVVISDDYRADQIQAIINNSETFSQ